MVRPLTLKFDRATHPFIQCYTRQATVVYTLDRKMSNIATGDIAISYKSTGDIGLCHNRKEQFKNSDRGYSHLLKSTGDIGYLSSRAPMVAATCFASPTPLFYLEPSGSDGVRGGQGSSVGPTPKGSPNLLLDMDHREMSLLKGQDHLVITVCCYDCVVTEAFFEFRVIKSC